MWCWEGEGSHNGSYTWNAVDGEWTQGYPGGSSCRHQPPPTACECWECLHSQCSRGRSYECDECANERYEREQEQRRNLIQGYGYRPEPYTMFGEGRTFMGVELELQESGNMYEAAQAAVDIMGDRGYLKEDGSVDGFEIVTQPHTHTEHLSGFDWNGLLVAMREHDMYADDGAGLHIHVSRAGFDGPAHAYRWQKFVYGNRDIWNDIARRTNSSWARWPSDIDAYGDRIRGFSLLNQMKGVAKGTKRVPKSRNAPEPAQPDYYYEMNVAGYQPQRYSVINPLNQHTLELRLFRSTTDPVELYSCIDLVDASVQYTRNLTVADVTKGDALSADAFRDYVNGNDAYSALASKL